MSYTEAEWQEAWNKKERQLREAERDLEVSEAGLTAVRGQVAELTRENVVLADQNIWLNQGCVDYEKELAAVRAQLDVARRALATIALGECREHEGRLVFDPQALASRALSSPLEAGPGSLKEESVMTEDLGAGRDDSGIGAQKEFKLRDPELVEAATKAVEATTFLNSMAAGIVALNVLDAIASRIRLASREGK